MRAMLCEHFDQPLALRDIPSPSIGRGQVRVAVEACGVNFVDGLIVSGKYQIRPSLPYTPGFEVAGTIIELTDDVTDLEVGNRVVATSGLSGGGFAEQVVVSSSQVFCLPENMSAGQGATFVQSYCTALFALTRRIQLREGQTLVVLGASGGVGRAAVDIGTALGARVIATASSDARLDACEDIAPHARINYQTEDLKSRIRALTDGGADVAYDPLGADYSEQAMRALGTDGTLLIVGFAAGSIPRLPGNQILLGNRRVVGVDWGGWRTEHPDLQRSLMDELLALAAAGKLHPREPASYPLASAAQALDDVNQRRIIGKVVLHP